LSTNKQNFFFLWTQLLATAMCGMSHTLHTSWMSHVGHTSLAPLFTASLKSQELAVTHGDTRVCVHGIRECVHMCVYVCVYMGRCTTR
jgi:hypothetical protein